METWISLISSLSSLRSLRSLTLGKIQADDNQSITLLSRALQNAVDFQKIHISFAYPSLFGTGALENIKKLVFYFVKSQEILQKRIQMVRACLKSSKSKLSLSNSTPVESKENEEKYDSHSHSHSHSHFSSESPGYNSNISQELPDGIIEIILESTFNIGYIWNGSLQNWEMKSCEMMVGKNIVSEYISEIQLQFATLKMAKLRKCYDVTRDFKLSLRGSEVSPGFGVIEDYTTPE